MTIALYTHAAMFDHRPGASHAERPERLGAVIDALNDTTNLDLESREAPLAPDSMMVEHNPWQSRRMDRQDIANLRADQR